MRSKHELEVISLQRYLADGLLSPSALENLTESERSNLADDFVYELVKKGIISVDRAKAATPEEFLRLTDYQMRPTIYGGVIPIEELLTLSTRRAEVLSSPNVKTMLSKFIFEPEDAIRLDSTFEFLDDDPLLMEEVMDQISTPELILSVYQLQKQLSLSYALQQQLTQLHGLLLRLQPKTTTQYFAVIYLLKEACTNDYTELTKSVSDEVMTFIDERVSIHFPHGLEVSMQQLTQESEGYRAYCYNIIKNSFRLERSAEPEESQEKKQLITRTLPPKVLVQFSMWMSQYKAVEAKAAETHSDPMNMGMQ